MKHRLTKDVPAAALAAALVLGVSRASGADTVELFDKGPTDLEFYAGVDGLGQGAEARSFGAEWVLGFGLTERLSAYLSGTHAANADLARTEHSEHLGLFSTISDGPHVDCDLGIELGADGSAAAGGAFIELNLDREPDLAATGLYVRLGAELYGRGPEEQGPSPGTALSAVVGGYVTLASVHQILLELDGIWHPRPGPGEARRDPGAARIGYNVTVADSLELINEVAVDVPLSDETWAWGGFTGFIATFGL